MQSGIADFVTGAANLANWTKHMQITAIFRQTRCLGSPVVRASDLRLDCREFDPRPLHYQSIGTGMGDRLRAGIPPRYATSQLSFLTSVGREMSTGQSAM